MGAICCKGSEPKNENEVHIDYSPGDVYNPNPKEAPEIGHVEDKKAALESFRGFQMVAQWNYTVNDEEITLPVERLVFSYTECKFEGEGVDGHGRFKVFGNLNNTGEVLIKLVHEAAAMLGKTFEGRFLENVATGEWSSGQNEKGTFRLELVSHVWHSSEAFIVLKSLNEFVGIGKFPYGYGFFTGTPKSEDTVHLDITFGDGKTGAFDFTLGEESIKGKFVSPAGEQDLYLVSRNEFA